MQVKKTKSYIEWLAERYERERLLIDSGAVFQTISNLHSPVSDVEIAMHLEISVGEVRNAIAQLHRDGLVSCDYRGDWEVAF